MCRNLFFIRVVGLRPSALLKKRLWHISFPVNFVKLFRKPFSETQTYIGLCHSFIWRNDILPIARSSRLQMLFRLGVLKNFQNSLKNTCAVNLMEVFLILETTPGTSTLLQFYFAFIFQIYIQYPVNFMMFSHKPSLSNY